MHDLDLTDDFDPVVLAVGEVFNVLDSNDLTRDDATGLDDFAIGALAKLLNDRIMV
jgi:hypothetical protein